MKNAKFRIVVGKGYVGNLNGGDGLRRRGNGGNWWI